MTNEIKVGDIVQWTHRRSIYRGLEFTLKEGTVVALEGDVAIIKLPNKYAARRRVNVSKLTVKSKQTIGTAG